MTRFSREFFARDTLLVARDLPGARLVRMLNGERLSGIIVECEAYKQDDTACHAHRGKTTRNAMMFGPPGHAYVYFVYGLHHMLNIVTEPADTPAAVLLRAIEPVEGIATMQRLRGVSSNDKILTGGPARLTRALAIDRAFNGCDLVLGQELWIEPGEPAAEQADRRIAQGARIGIGYAAEHDRLAPWRFWLSGNRYVSR